MATINQGELVVVGKRLSDIVSGCWNSFFLLFFMLESVLKGSESCDSEERSRTSLQID